MLVLERKLNQTIVIQSPTGEDIEIHIRELTRSKAKIGIHAPDDYLIFREEVLLDSDEVAYD